MDLAVNSGLVSAEVGRALMILAMSPEGARSADFHAASLDAVLARLRASGLVVGDDEHLRLNDQHLLAPAAENVGRVRARLIERLWWHIAHAEPDLARVSLDLDAGEIILEPGLDPPPVFLISVIEEALDRAGVRELKVRFGSCRRDCLEIWPSPQMTAGDVVI